MEDRETNIDLLEKPKPIPRLNSSDAIRKIEDINKTIADIQKEFANNSGEYCLALSEKWGSNKAVDIGNQILNRIEDIDRELVYLDESTINDACSSFNGVASSHDTRSIYVQAGPFCGIKYVNFKDNLNGAVGMHTDDVKNCTEEYVAVLESLKKKIGNIPRNIGFYDVNGTLVKTFNTKVDKINSIVNDSLDLIDREVKNAVLNEVDLTEAAVKSATSEFSS